MRSDAERFDQRKLIERQTVRFMQEADRDTEQRAHAAIGVNPQTLKMNATVVSPQPAGVAGPTGQVRLDSTAVSGTDAVVVCRNGHHFDSKLVTQDARIAEERLAAGEGVQVRAADAYAMDADERFIGFGCGRRCLAFGEFARLIKNNYAHLFFFACRRRESQAGGSERFVPKSVEGATPP